MPNEDSKRTYILNMRDGSKQKITVPAGWRLTFGPLVPGSKDSGTNGRDALVLRVYEGNKDNQRAVFTGVESWRDTRDLEIQVEQVQRKQQMARVDIPGEGNQDVAVQMETRHWVDPDKPVTPRSELQEPGGKLIQLDRPRS
jgi:hypothetical protein